MKPIRVLHIVTSMNMGGIENFIMNNYRNIDRTRVQFDFFKHRDTHDFFDDEIRSLGGKIYYAPPINPLKQVEYDRKVQNFFEEHKEMYSIVHSHINTFSSYPLRVAKQVGIPVRIAHAHATTNRVDFKTPFRIYTKKIINRYITDAFACSEASGKWLFSDFPYQCIPNAIDTLSYLPKEEIKEKLCSEFGVKDAFVIGMVANFSAIKNHHFIVNVFKKIVEKIPDSYLIFVGDGATREAVKKQVESLNLTNRVIFTGIRSDISDVLQVFDVFVLPSISEGFAISVLEAETLGIPCIVSTGVPADVKLFAEMNTTFLPITNEDVWVDKIISLQNEKKKNWVNEVSQTAFDIKSSAKILMDFYEHKFNTL